MQNNLSFDDIAKDILDNKKYCKLANETHHGITRMSHSMRVARNTYKLAKKLHLNYVAATRAALLHDFFLNEEFGSNLGWVQGIIHPSIALQNAKGEFDLSDKECNAIAAHMFPMCATLPRYKESWVITIVDKGVAIYEYFTFKFNYTRFTRQVASVVTIAGLFLFNVLTMGRR